MISGKTIKLFGIFSVAAALFSCTPEKITLHGDISGIVTDAETSQPVPTAAVKLLPANDTTHTGSLGEYEFRNVLPGNYEVEASKFAYEKTKKSATVEPETTTEVNITLPGVPAIEFSVQWLDFGFDTTLKSFTIKNIGKGNLQYTISPVQNWITAEPSSGDITTETDTVKVTINKAGLSGDKYEEIIRITSYTGSYIQQDTIDVLLNGVADINRNYYGTVTIGTQTWLAENLNTGTMIINGLSKPADNGLIEKYCYNDDPGNCDIYGGIYSWPEMMNYNEPDTKPIGTTQGICPTGWHIPTNTEWLTLQDFLGGGARTGGKLKETGFTHWKEPNTAATNEWGFTGLGGGFLGFTGNDPSNFGYKRLKEYALFWASEIFEILVDNEVFYLPHYFGFFYNNESGGLELNPVDPIDLFLCSVRCIKDPGKK